LINLKLYPGEYSIMDLLAVQRAKPYRASATPFGLDVTMHRYVGRSVPWKFVKGVENIRAIGGGATRVADKIAELGRISSAHRETGVVLATIRGRVVLLPRKAFEVARAHGVPAAILASAGSAAELLAVRA
jgi:hypothetical protein